MTLPFTLNEFLRVLHRYNDATWPAAIVLPFVGLVCAWLLLSEKIAARRASLLMLAALWLWMAIAYHFAFFAEINPAAKTFGLAFLLQALLFVYAAMGSVRVATPRLDPGRAMGGALIAFSLIVYPALSYLAGHRYPEMPTFGLPCPTTIFTLGVLASLDGELDWKYAVVPIGWAVIGASAATKLGMTEDLALPVAAFALMTLKVTRRVSHRPPVLHTWR